MCKIIDLENYRASNDKELTVHFNDAFIVKRIIPKLQELNDDIKFFNPNSISPNGCYFCIKHKGDKEDED